MADILADQLLGGLEIPELQDRRVDVLELGLDVGNGDARTGVLNRIVFGPQHLLGLPAERDIPEEETQKGFFKLQDVHGDLGREIRPILPHTVGLKQRKLLVLKILTKRIKERAIGT